MVAVVVLAVAGMGWVLGPENGRVAGANVGGDAIAIASGREAYRTRCASCHGIEARGDGPVGAALRVAPPDLTWLAERHGGTFPRAYVIDVVIGNAAVAAHGTREMPVWSDRLGPTDGSAAAARDARDARRLVESLATYLESLQRRLSARKAR
jgi:mono/diheme cytochrome c family protein